MVGDLFVAVQEEDGELRCGARRRCGGVGFVDSAADKTRLPNRCEMLRKADVWQQVIVKT
jgi:hypothetical protein